MFNKQTSVEKKAKIFILTLYNRSNVRTEKLGHLSAPYNMPNFTVKKVILIQLHISYKYLYSQNEFYIYMKD